MSPIMVRLTLDAILLVVFVLQLLRHRRLYRRASADGHPRLNDLGIHGVGILPELLLDLGDACASRSLTAPQRRVLRQVWLRPPGHARPLPGVWIDPGEIHLRAIAVCSTIAQKCHGIILAH